MPIVQYTASAAGSVLQMPEPPLATLSGDLYDRQKFNNLNDNSFTELVSSIEGVGVQEFFTLYQDLKNTIPVGSADLLVSVGDTLFNDMVQTLLNIEAATVMNLPLTDLMNHLSALVSQISQLNDFIVVSGTDTNTLSFLIADAVKLVPSLNDKFKRLFDYIISILLSNANLANENVALRSQVDALQKQVTQLTVLINKLTAPTDVGFHVEPDLFSFISNPLIAPGTSVQLVVCGSANYQFDIPSEFQNTFTIIPNTPAPSHTIHTNGNFVGDYAYFTVVNGDQSSGIGLTERVLFEFPKKFIGSGTGTTLITNIPNNNIILYVLDPASFDGFGIEDPETVSIRQQFAQLPSLVSVIVSPTAQANGSPFQIVPDPNVGSGPTDIFNLDADAIRNGLQNPSADGTLHFIVTPKSTVNATENHAIVVTDANGVQAVFSVEVRVVKISPVPLAVALKTSSSNVSVGIGTTTNVVISGGENGVYKITGPSNAAFQTISSEHTAPGPVTYQITGKQVGQGLYKVTNIPSGEYLTITVNVGNNV